MEHKFDLPLSSISNAVLKSIMHRVANYTVGFLRIEKGKRDKDLTLLGSGTLVTAKGIHAILTAHHVIEVLPSGGELGLVYSTVTHAPLATDALRYLKNDRGNLASEGPDLGAVILPANVVAMLSGRKSFHNLDRNRTKMLTEPPAIADGLWIVQGFIGALTREELDFERRVKVKRVIFHEHSSSGFVSREYAVGDHDYFDYPLEFVRPSQPRNYGGTSGGGLWQVRLEKGADAEIKPANVPILSGVAFYQGPIESNQSVLKCHGRRSVYAVAYEAITACR